MLVLLTVSAYVSTATSFQAQGLFVIIGYGCNMSPFTVYSRFRNLLQSSGMYENWVSVATRALRLLAIGKGGRCGRDDVVPQSIVDSEFTNPP